LSGGVIVASLGEALLVDDHLVGLVELQDPFRRRGDQIVNVGTFDLFPVDLALVDEPARLHLGVVAKLAAATDTLEVGEVKWSTDLGHPDRW